MFGNNQEKTEISGKTIERDMLNELQRSEQEYSETAPKGAENINLGAFNASPLETGFKQVPIPTELFKPSYLLGVDIINEYRLKKIASKHHERAKEILTPTDTEVEQAAGLTGYLVGYFEHKYGANILNSPWIGPLMLAGKFGLQQIKKEKALRTYIEVAEAGGEQ